MAKLRLDLHILCKRGKEIDFERNRIMQEAIDKKIALVEFIPGKGSGLEAPSRGPLAGTTPATESHR